MINNIIKNGVNDAYTSVFIPKFAVRLSLKTTPVIAKVKEPKTKLTRFGISKEMNCILIISLVEKPRTESIA